MMILRILMGIRRTQGRGWQHIDRMLGVLTDPRVDDGEGVVGLVGDDVDIELWVGLQQVLLLVLQTLELDLVKGIAGVGDQLPQKDFLHSDFRCWWLSVPLNFRP